MLATLDLSLKLDEKTYKKELKQLETQLLSVQQKARELKIPVLTVFEGWSAAGKGTIISKLLHPLDPRYFNVVSTRRTSDDTVRRPFLWPYATNTPAGGEITVFDKSWHRMIIPDGKSGRQFTEIERERFYYDVSAFEEQLTDSGVLVIKFFLHISREEQKKRFSALEKDKDTKWRVDENDWEQNKNYDKYLPRFDQMLEASDFKTSRWSVIPADDGNYATVTVYKTVISRIEAEISRRAAMAVGVQKAEKSENNGQKEEYKDVLGAVNLSGKKVGKDEYKKRLEELQAKIEFLGYKLYSKRRAVIIVYEGWDAAGKGGNIKRLTQKLDPRGYEVVPIAAPSPAELDHHYLWRFWRQIPKDGHLAIFDRSWYGRVMVERVEGFCSEADWKRAYKEMNDMEFHLHNHGAVIFKFWLHIDKEEQLARFTSRQNDPLKQFKITDEDWRNREKWDKYEEAVNEMLNKTSTDYAPWHIIESNDKQFARLKTLQIVVSELEKRLK
ncbi:polyphosphate:AMP phosphotransferase [Clostridia bacterium]|nr:polyphosphate:AMP phosphotransferase [Clostridia bacterium]